MNTGNVHTFAFYVCTRLHPANVQDNVNVPLASTGPCFRIHKHQPSSFNQTVEKQKGSKELSGKEETPAWSDRQ